MRQFYETFPKWNAKRSELNWPYWRILMHIKESDISPKHILREPYILDFSGLEEKN